MKLYNTPGLSQIYFRRSPSPPYLKKSPYESTGFFFVYCTHRGDEKPRPGVDNWRQPVGQTVNAVSGLPAGRAKRVNPPLTAIFKEELVRRYGLFFVYCTHRGDEKPRPGYLVNAPVHSLSPRLMGEFCHESPRPEEFPPI